MPTVPRYNENSVREAPIPGARLTPSASQEAFGGGASLEAVGAAQRGLSSDVQKIIAFEREKADKLNVQDFDTTTAQAKIDILNKAKSMRGKDAAGALDFADAEWNKAVEANMKAMKNDRQRQEADLITKAQYLDINKQIQAHMSSEFVAYDQESTYAKVDVALEEALSDPYDMEKISLSLFKQQRTLEDYAERNGKSKEWLEAEYSKYKSGTHSAVIERMLAEGQDIQAKGYYDAIKDELLEAEETRVKAVLEEGSLRGESQRKLTEILHKASTRDAALTMAYLIEDPKLQDEVKRRVNQYYDEQRVIENENRERRFQHASKLVEETHDRNSIAPSDWLNLTISERNALDARAKQLREGTPPTTEWETYYELKSLASDESTQNKFLRANLMEYRHKMADSEFKELITLQAALRKGDDAATTEIGGYRTVAQVVNDSLAAAGIEEGAKAKKADLQRVAQFRHMIDEQVSQWKQQTGKKNIPPEEVQKIVDNLLIKGTVPGSGFFGFFKSQRHVFELKDGESIAVDADDIPRRERVKIESALRARGLPVNDESVLGLYNRKIQGMIK